MVCRQYDHGMEDADQSSPSRVAATHMIVLLVRAEAQGP